MQRRTITKVSEAILFGEDPCEHTGEEKLMGWVTDYDGQAVFGERCGSVVGISVKRESIAWVVAGVRAPVAAGRLDAPILPLEGRPATVEELRSHLVDALREVAEALPLSKVGAIGLAWPGGIGPNGEARDYPIHHSKLSEDRVQRNQPLGAILLESLRTAGLAAQPGEQGGSLGVPAVSVVNDADADLLFESRRGVARDVADVVAIKVCGGISMGVMFNRCLVRGGTGSAGSIEHLKVRPGEVENLEPDWSDIKDLDDLQRCACTGSKCVGRFASGAAIIEQLARYIEPDDLTPNERGRQVEREPDQGVVTAVCGRAGRLLGEALLGPIVAIDPERIIVNAFPHNDYLLNEMRTVLTRGTSVRLGWNDIVEGTREVDSTAAGAAQRALEESVLPEMERALGGEREFPHRYDLPPWLRLQIPESADPVPARA